ncbi:MAG: pyruvate kinase [Chitinispirillaceae bacterium]|nr:pyruvate kinase [Chitinispirillaceae bacterium]
MKAFDKRVKIVATIGPASGSSSVIRDLIQKGVNVFRLNFSHGDHETHRNTIRKIRSVTDRLGVDVAVLADLQGPKIRTRATEGNRPVEVKTGSLVRITSRNVISDATVISVDYGKLAKEVGAGQQIMINDGAIRLKVTGIGKNGDLIAKVLSGGEYASHKGVNFPDVDLSIPSLTRKDRSDLDFILKEDIQFIALSFVRKAQDVISLRKIIEKKRQDIKIIAKIEKPEAARAIDSILDHTDGIMVARGDLGVEATPFTVPILQKELILHANARAKLVIVATQMLESMIQHPLPTRAESTDVANAIIDGTDAIMLSGETAMGKYPGEAVATMAQIVQETEKSRFINHDMVDLTRNDRSAAHALCEAAVWAGRDLGGIPLCVFTLSGSTALYLSKLHYEAPIIAFSPENQVVKMLSLAWNITAVPLPFITDIEELHTSGEAKMLERKWVKRGDFIGIISGTNSIRGATNTFRIRKVGGV